MKLLRFANSMITTKRIALLMCLGLAASLVALLMVARYNVPSADDYTHGLWGYRDWNENHSVLSLIKISFDYSVQLYHNWTGLYTIGIIPLFAPFIMHNYWIIAYITILPLCFGVLFLVFVVLRKFFDAGIWENLLIAAVTSAFVIQVVPSAAESFYWHAAATTYTTANALFFVSMGLLILAYHSGSKNLRTAYIAVSSVLAVIYSGANFITSFGGVGLLLLVICFSLLLKNKAWKIVLIPAVFSTAAFLLTVTAPGNAARLLRIAERGTPEPSAFRAVFASLVYGFQYIFKDVSPFLWLGVLFLVPFFIKTAKSNDFSYKRPLAVSALSYLYFCSLSCPDLYASGGYGPGPPRVLGAYSNIFVILLVLNVFYWTGWAVRTLLNERINLVGKPKESGEIQNEKTESDIIMYFCRKYALPGLLVFSWIFVFLTFVSIRDGSFMSYSITNAASDLVTGRGAKYYAEYQARLEILTDPEIKDAVLEPFSDKAKALFFDDIKEDKEHWINKGVRDFYRKGSVRLRDD